jgi:hypothetical protein
VKTKTSFILYIVGLFATIVACGNASQNNAQYLATTSATSAETQNVVVSKPSKQEMDELLTLSKLPTESCSDTQQGKTCLIQADQAIKWGWGFCKNEPSALNTALSKVEVGLFVDGEKIPENLIYQRDEEYDRSTNAYCHVWIVKLSNWRSGASIKLENRAVASILDTDRNEFLIKVEK